MINLANCFYTLKAKMKHIIIYLNDRQYKIKRNTWKFQT